MGVLAAFHGNKKLSQPYSLLASTPTYTWSKLHLKTQSTFLLAPFHKLTITTARPSSTSPSLATLGTLLLLQQHPCSSPQPPQQQHHWQRHQKHQQGSHQASRLVFRRITDSNDSI